jgi:protein-S-isoprenylcysteine O-methyltransferase Ste14
MRTRTAVAGSAAFFVLAPGIVAGWVPWRLTGWRMGVLPPYAVPGRVLGIAMVTTGVAVLVHAFVRFVLEGVGTPAPVAPPEHLVVGGLYRHVRNPMYLAVVTIIVGQALLLPHLLLVAYATAVFVVVATFVRCYEEPDLSRRFGADYEAYRHAVRAWWPRLRPWQPGHGDPT